MVIECREPEISIEFLTIQMRRHRHTDWFLWLAAGRSEHIELTRVVTLDSERA
jgi:hypothetical protein